jgi:hypothetical protein
MLGRIVAEEANGDCRDPVVPENKNAWAVGWVFQEAGAVGHPQPYGRENKAGYSSSQEGKQGLLVEPSRS